jgi:hypothetical protein
MAYTQTLQFQDRSIVFDKLHLQGSSLFCFSAIYINRKRIEFGAVLNNFNKTFNLFLERLKEILVP